jgi:hypothetical protein
MSVRDRERERERGGEGTSTRFIFWCVVCHKGVSLTAVRWNFSSVSIKPMRGSNEAPMSFLLQIRCTETRPLFQIYVMGVVQTILLISHYGECRRLFISDKNVVSICYLYKVYGWSMNWNYTIFEYKGHFILVWSTSRLNRTGYIEYT